VITTVQKASLASRDSIESFAREGEFADLAAYWEPRWYAAYTRANHERGVHDQFLQRSIDSFLPAYRSVRRWKDRQMRLQLPLFPGYVFVRIPLRERLRVLEVRGVAWLVGFNGLPAALEEGEVESLRRALAQGSSALPHRYLTIGQRVRVIEGPLQGAEGIVARRKGNFRLVLSISLIKRSVMVDVSAGDLEVVSCTRGVQ